MQKSAHPPVIILSGTNRKPTGSSFSPSGRERTDGWSSTIGTDAVPASGRPDDDVWRPAVAPGEVTVTDVTLNSLTVTFRESRMAKGFFRDCELQV